MKNSLADALVLDHPDAPWQPPAVLPPTADLRRAVTILEQRLTPVGYDHVLFCTGKLITGFNERLTKDEAKARARVWMESCSDVPTDLWSAATMKLLRTWKRDDHYGRVPEPSDFRAVVQDQLHRRSVELQRAKAMLGKANKAAAPKADIPIREDSVARLRRILREQREADVPEADRQFNMANTERALALAEKRLMEPWAQQFFDERVAERGGRARESIGHQAAAVVKRNGPTNQRLAELAKANREGRPAPEFRDIPEVA